MGDALRVRGTQGVGQGGAPLEDLRRRTPARRDMAIETLPVDELHDEKSGAADILDREQRDDVWMIEACHHARFVLEAREPIGIGSHVGGQDLERHVAAETRVARAVDLAHSTRAERRDDVISAQASSGRERHRATVTHPFWKGPPSQDQAIDAMRQRAGTRRRNSSAQLSTTTTCGEVRDCDAAALIMRKRPSAPTSYDGGCSNAR